MSRVIENPVSGERIVIRESQDPTICSVGHGDDHNTLQPRLATRRSRFPTSSDLELADRGRVGLRRLVVKSPLAVFIG